MQGATEQQGGRGRAGGGQGRQGRTEGRMAGTAERDSWPGVAWKSCTKQLFPPNLKLTALSPSVPQTGHGGQGFVRHEPPSAACLGEFVTSRTTRAQRKTSIAFTSAVCSAASWSRRSAGASSARSSVPGSPAVPSRSKAAACLRQPAPQGRGLRSTALPAPAFLG